MKPFWKKTLFIVLALFLVLLVFFPQIVSLPFGQKIFLEAIRSHTHTKVTAKEMKLSWLGPQKFSALALDSERFNGSLEELRIGVPLWSLLPFLELKDFSQINGDIKIANGAFHFESDQFSSVQLDSIQGIVRFHQGGIDFTTDGQARYNNKNGSYNLQGQIRNVDQNQVAFSIRGDWVSFPMLPIARILNIRYQIDENKVLQLIGDSFDLQNFASFSGDEGMFELTVHTPNIDSSIHGSISHNDLMLQKPLTASIHLTPELSQWILRDVNPLFVTGIEANSPIHLRIEPSQFRCPLASFRLENIYIGQGTLDLGQLRCSNGGSLAALVSLLKNNALSQSQEMNVWLTPLFFSLHDGVLETSRVDFLIDHSLHLCTWGKIDYLDDQLDMYVGIPAETLQHSFGIQKLPNDYVMKVPLTGSLKKPKLAGHGAATKIAALLTAQKSSHNWLSSGILTLFGETDTSVPPPHRPFPWEK